MEAAATNFITLAIGILISSLQTMPLTIVFLARMLPYNAAVCNIYIYIYIYVCVCVCVCVNCASVTTQFFFFQFKSHKKIKRKHKKK